MATSALARSGGPVRGGSSGACHDDPPRRGGAPVNISMIDASTIDMIRLGAGVRQGLRGSGHRAFGKVERNRLNSAGVGFHGDNWVPRRPRRTRPSRTRQGGPIYMDTNYTTKSQEAISGAMQAAATANNLYDVSM